MQLFAVGVQEDGGGAPDLGAAVRCAARAFPQLDPDTLSQERSASGALTCAWMSHAATVAAPRRYAARNGHTIVLFDGFPLERRGRFAAHEAAALAEHWDTLPDVLEGIFSALRIDLAVDRAECLTDALGLAPVYLHRGRGRLLLANSVEILRHAAGLRGVDELGVASLVAMGWPAERATLDGVEILQGGGVHRLGPGGVTFDGHLTPATMAAAARQRPPLPVGQLLDTTRVAVAAGAPMRSALTAGRDTRVLLALTRAADIDADFYTSGPPQHPDVRLARRIAADLGLRHQVLEPQPPDDLDVWAAQTTAFVRRTDGLSPIDAISDHLDHDGTTDRLGLELWGVAAEIGRTNRWVTSSLASVTPVARSSYDVQRRVLYRMAGDPAGLLKPAAAAAVRTWVDGFVDRRRDEGWAAEDIYGTFYAFGRVHLWGSRGVRRAAATTDLFSPFASRGYLEHCFGLSAAERYVERPHRALIGAYAPEVDAEPYEHPWRPERPDRALAYLLDEVAIRVRQRAAARIGRNHAGPAPLHARWLEAGLARHRDVALSCRDAPVWDVIDRGRYEALLAGTPEERAAHASPLSRAFAAVWHLCGPDA